MTIKITFFVCLGFLAFACANQESPSLRHANDERYYSTEGRFSIGLPDYPIHSEIPAVAGKSAVGHNFSWKTDGGLYMAGYTDWLIEPLEESEIVRVSSENIINAAIKSGGKLLASEETNFGHHKGIESKFLISKNIFLYRHIVQGNRIYVLSARWPEDKDGGVETKTLNSFRIEN